MGVHNCFLMGVHNCLNDLLETAKRLNQHWLKGIGTAMVLAKIK